MITQEVHKRFLTNTDETGRFIVTSLVTGVKYYVEPIGKTHTNWGDVNPATGKIEGSYGNKYSGSVSEKESLITEENGFKCIGLYEGSGMDEINKRDKAYEAKGYRVVKR